MRDATQSENSPWREFLRAFWEDLYPYLAAHSHPWAQGRSARSDNYISSVVGKGGVAAGVDFSRAPSRISVRIWLEGESAKKHFDLLASNRSSIEAEFPGEDLFWERRDEKNNSTVFVARPYDGDKISRATPDRDALFSWIAQNLTTFRDIAKKYLVGG